MATLSIADAARAIEHRDIHLAVCRARRQHLLCSPCCELTARADRALRAVAPIGEAA
jgi:transposase